LDLPYNKRRKKACALSAELLLPDRRTFDRLLKTVSSDIKERISMMGNLFVLESPLVQIIYSKRCISIEPLIEHIKSAFRIDPLPVRGYDKVHSIVLLSVLLFQLLVYYNCKIQKKNNPRRMIKYMLGC
jgi:hypothetical protein